MINDNHGSGADISTLPEISKISTHVDFEREGKQLSWLKVPNSTNASGWGSLLIPIAVIKNGEGPTVLFTAGNHGDEYEGQLALQKLARDLEPEQVQGRVIVMPGMNFPAVLAGTRLSPVDGRNMNRVFPGDHNGTMTLMIAHYVYHRLVRLADVVVDIHSGGSSMIFEPCAVIHHLDDTEQMDRTLATARQFGTPITLVLRELDNVGMLDTVVEEMGKVFISTELGGGAYVTPRTVGYAETGVYNVLRHLGVVPGEVVEPGSGPTRLMAVPEEGGFAMAMTDGLYEPLVEVGEEVATGTPLGRIYSLHDLEQPPQTVTAGCDGVLVTRAGRGQVKRGDTVVVMATDWAG